MITERTPDVLEIMSQQCVRLAYSTLQVTTRAEDHGLDRPISPNPYMMDNNDNELSPLFLLSSRRFALRRFYPDFFFYVRGPGPLKPPVAFSLFFSPPPHSRRQQGRPRTRLRRIPPRHRVLHHDQRGIAAQNPHRRDEDQDRAAVDITETST